MSSYGLSTQGKYVYRKESTLWHSAPEVFKGKRELKSDVWSLGITLIELAEGKNPFNGLCWSEIQKWLCDRDPPSLSSEKWSAECVGFVEKCLTVDVKERWSVEQLMEVSGCGIG